mgnify:FL=1
MSQSNNVLASRYTICWDDQVPGDEGWAYYEEAMVDGEWCSAGSGAVEGDFSADPYAKLSQLLPETPFAQVERSSFERRDGGGWVAVV